MSVKKRKLRNKTSTAKRSAAEAAKRKAKTPSKARTAARARTGRSAALAKRVAAAKTKTAARKRTNSAGRSRSPAEAARRKSKAAKRVLLQKASARQAKARLKAAQAARAARAKQIGKAPSAAGAKPVKGGAVHAAHSPAPRLDTPKVVSERRAHAEAVLALRARTAKPRPHEGLTQKRPAPPSAARPNSAAAQRGSAPSHGMPAAPVPPQAFEKPGDVQAKPAVKSASSPKPGFKPMEFIVYPAHGVGQILAIEEQEVAGFKLELFVISFAKDKMILKVPTPKTVSVGMRKLASGEVVKQALDTLTGRARIKRTMWSRRAQEYEAKINSGDLVAIAEVVRDLYRSEAQPEQSYSERQLYEAALDRVARELAVVHKLTETESLKLIESQLQKGPRRGKEADAAGGETDEGGIDEAA